MAGLHSIFKWIRPRAKLPSRLERFNSALVRVREHQAYRPDSIPVRWIVEQLEYLIGLETGVADDFSKLPNINIGLLALREIEDCDKALAHQLYEIADDAQKMANAWPH